MAGILNTGRSKIALQQGNSQPLNVAKFVFANIPGLVTTDPVNLAQGMPPAGQIVFQKPKTAQGYVAQDQVVYSVILTPDEGNFTFNWVGLVDADNVLIAVAYTAPVTKYKTVGLSVGNTITRNFLLQFNNAAAITGITVSAEAWQIDFIGRLNSMDESLRADMSDLYGAGFFINNGFQIFSAGNVVSARAGVGYVGGYRVVLAADTVIATGALPKDIYIDAVLEQDVSSSIVTTAFTTSTAAVPLTNYTDGLGRKHYLVKIASVTAAYAVTDLRKYIPSTTAVVEYLLAQLALKSNIASPTFTGTPKAPTAAVGTNTTQLANTAYVQAELAALIDSSPTTLNTLNELAAALGDDPNFATTIANALGLKAPLASPALTGTPTAPTAAAGTNTTQLANTAFVQAALAALIDSSPSTLNTLNELAAALGDDPNFATTISNALGLKAPLASPALTGTPTAPTAAAGTNTTQLANTAFVQAAIQLLAAVARTGNAADLTGTLAAARLPFSYSTATTAGYVPQRDGSGHIYVPDSPINEQSAKAASMNSVIMCVNAAIAALVDSSPTTLNTLNELAAALGDDPNFRTTILNLLAAKAPLASPGFTGAPTAPTAPIGTKNTQLANTEFVQNLVSTISLKWSGSATSVNISGFGFGFYLVKTHFSGSYGLIFYCGVRMTAVYFGQIISGTLGTGLLEVSAGGVIGALRDNIGTPLTIDSIYKVGG